MTPQELLEQLPWPKTDEGDVKTADYWLCWERVSHEVQRDVDDFDEYPAIDYTIVLKTGVPDSFASEFFSLIHDLIFSQEIDMGITGLTCLTWRVADRAKECAA